MKLSEILERLIELDEILPPFAENLSLLRDEVVAASENGTLSPGTEVSAFSDYEYAESEELCHWSEESEKNQVFTLCSADQVISDWILACKEHSFVPNEFFSDPITRLLDQASFVLPPFSYIPWEQEKFPDKKVTQSEVIDIVLMADEFFPSSVDTLCDGNYVKDFCAQIPGSERLREIQERIRLELRNAANWARDTARDGTLLIADSDDSSPPGGAEKILPHWDDKKSTLTLGGIVIKTLRGRAAAQRPVLNQFQDEGWPEKITLDTEIYHPEKVNETCKSLNHNLLGIKFSSNGNGTGICWVKI